MRSITRIPFVAAAIAVVALAPATSPAYAGGPTSVLVVNPSTQATASLYTTDATYTRLLEALGPARGDVADADVPIGLRGGPGTSAINLTWLVHDVTVWRVDRLQIDGEGDPWVQTSQSYTSDELWSSEGPWRRPAEPDQVLRILKRLGVLGTEPAAELDTTDLDTATSRDTAASQVASSESDPGAATGWWWLLPGVAAGVAIGLMSRPYAAAMLDRRKSGPRQQLIDV